MWESVQAVADRFAETLNRSVFVEDAAFRPLATSAQLGTIDDARVQALLERAPTEEHVRYFRACGVTRALEPLRVPASDAHGLLPRVMVPVTTGTRVLARIWLIDAEPPVGADEVAHVVEGCRDLRTDLLDRRNAVRPAVAAGSRLLREIRHAGEERRRALFQELRDVHGVTDLERLRAVVVRVAADHLEAGGDARCDADAGPVGLREDGAGAGDAGDESHDEGDDLAAPDEAGDPVLLRHVLDTLVEPLEAGGALGCARRPGLLLLVAGHGSGRSTLADVTAAARRARALHGVALGTVGVGGPVGATDGVDASVRQAEYAARVAAVREATAGAAWDDLGEDRLFSAVEWSRDGVAALDPGVAALADERRTPLASTLLAYLEREGNVDATAAALDVHRTTLYYRVERAREVLGQDLDGPARFRIHAALRLADLAGLLVPATSRTTG